LHSLATQATPTTLSGSSSSLSSTPSSTAPTATPLTGCPEINGTVYTSLFTNGKSGPVPSGAGLKFVKVCSLDLREFDIVEGYFMTFNECIELCASLKFFLATIATVWEFLSIRRASLQEITGSQRNDIISEFFVCISCVTRMIRPFMIEHLILSSALRVLVPFNLFLSTLIWVCSLLIILQIL
jgi:hypothetical protein